MHSDFTVKRLLVLVAVIVFALGVFGVKFAGLNPAEVTDLGLAIGFASFLA